ncbi:MAG: hypothetical protein R3E60_02175 [Alphaproteobacteria bacterium]
MVIASRWKPATGILAVSLPPKVGLSDDPYAIENSFTNRDLFRDDHRITFTIGFGQFQLGDTAGAANVMQYQAPGVTKIGVVDGTDLLMNPQL